LVVDGNCSGSVVVVAIRRSEEKDNRRRLGCVARGGVAWVAAWNAVGRVQPR
jgi:hypothetical protein